MSNSDINFLSENKLDKVKSKRLNKVRKIALFFILFVGLFSVLSFLLNFSSPLNSIKKQQAEVLSQITLQQAKAAKLSIVNERAASIISLYGERSAYPNILKSVIEGVPSDVKTAGLDIGSSSMTITFSSDSLLSLNNFLDSLISLSEKNSSIKSVFLDTLTVSNNSDAYTMAVRIELK